ncbi:MAG: NAD(P)H-quinone oxidoreductase subunit 2, chloroplastic [Acidimicrobiales bacterium]|nr:MAG: NADH-quinone oxidoreductase subunit L [Actinomycetota bacterium]MBV6507320.1 NAD(P)H-quinone oxidoreductase subunit 2, chloroplastic [Acidimicrobiales bacterium]RIK02964.1 MAG: NADH-quinone oxidoreductase subunit L [Acidobacteriota bacterium]
MLDYVWIIPALPALSFVLILLFGKRLPKGGSEVGIALVGAAFVLSVIVGVQWIDRVESADSAEHAGAESAELEEQPVSTEETEGELIESETAAGSSGAFADVEPECSQAATAVDVDEAAQASHGTATAPSAEGGEGGHEAAPETQPVVRCVTWFETSGGDVTAGTMVDGLSVMMIFVVSFISLLVHIYSTDYVSGDRRYTHFFAFLSLFTASMLLLVLSSNTLQMMVGWELVGLCSFVLIGHWWEDKPNSDAALKAFITNRVGDIGLLVGVSIMFFAAGGTFSILDINIAAETGVMSHGWALAASVALMFAVMSKSGQFFLHTWLPDAMAGPTPVSALIHAATMVVAGVFLIARLYSVFWEGFQIFGSDINFMAFIGGFTTIIGALLAFAQKDIKKVLAYSTISQLGYMVMALGVGAWTAAVFHLFTHAFFKACLFLGAGSMSNAAHHSFDMVDDYGGLKKYMPITFWTYLISTLALAGLPPLAGFWSKDEILAGTGSLTEANGNYHLMLIFGGLTALLTAAYMFRTIWYSFYGQYRGHGTPQESGPRITAPLVILATFAVLAGFVNAPWWEFFKDWVEPVGAYFPGEIVHAEFNIGLAALSTALGLTGIALAFLYFWRGLGPHGLTAENRFARGGYLFLERKYYLDWLYEDVIVAAVKGPIARATYWINQRVIDRVVDEAGRTSVRAGKLVYEYVDQKVVDTVVNGSGVAAEESGEELRRIQTGRVQQYAALLFAAAAILGAIFVFVIG